jgi:hypothetical protein
MCINQELVELYLDMIMYYILSMLEFDSYVLYESRMDHH